MKNIFLIENMRQVRSTLNRFFAILIITVLGVAFFAGLRATGPAMRETGERFMNETNFMDIHLLSTVGFNDDDVEAVRNAAGVGQVAPGYSVDVLLKMDEESPAVKLISISDTVNKPELLEGQLPDKTGECLIDSSFAAEYGYLVGDKVRFLSGTSDPLEDYVATGNYTISGIARSPLFISEDRGTSTVGSGKTEAFFYIPQQDFTLEVYTDVYLTVAAAEGLLRFEDSYTEVLKPIEETLKVLGKERSAIRYTEIDKEARVGLANAKVDVKTGYNKLEKAKKQLEDARRQLDDARKKLDDGKAEYADGKAEFEQKMADARKKLDDGNAEYNTGLKQYQDGLSEYETKSQTAQAEFANAEKQLDDAQAQYDAGMAALAQGKEMQQSLMGLLAQGNDPVAIATIAGIAQQMQGTQPELAAALVAYTQTPDDPVAAATAKAAVEQFGAALSKNEEELTAAKTKIDNGRAAIEAGKAELAAAKTRLDEAKAQLDEAKRKLAKGESELADGRAEGQQKLDDAAKEIADGETELADGEKKYEDGLRKYEEERADALVDLQEGEQEIADGEKDLASFEKPEWFVLNNETNAGFVSYKQDTHRLDAIGAVIPVFFFMLAVFVTMTSMTRLVESDRAYIGTVKALGFGDGAIAMRYLLYAFTASFIGGLLGLFVGYSVLPPLIFDAYKMMYTLPELQSDFPVALSFVSVALAVVCATLPAYLVCLNSVHEKPSELMRAEAPKDGKRILMERITPLWKRLSFMQKVTIRNIFRYKKRLFMTLIGVAGCTALMFTGFAIKDAISTIVPRQYDAIFTYDMQVGYGGEEDDNYAAAMDAVANSPEVESQLKTKQLAVDAISDDVLKSTMLVVPEDAAALDEFIYLRERNSARHISLTDDSVVISEKLADLLDVKKGDAILLRDSDANEVEVTVGGINENYLGHYVYMSKHLYENSFNDTFQPNQGLYHVTGLDETRAEEQLSYHLMEIDDVSTVSFISDARASMQKTIDALYIIVLVLVVSAAALIFVVLFSLISINIEERGRELATIKVLGFYDKELSSYIYRESNILTIVGMLAGIVLGVLLQRFILTTMETNFMMFSRDILWQSYVFSAGLTGFFAFIVNIMMRRHFKFIDMISSLKSVE